MKARIMTLSEIDEITNFEQAVLAKKNLPTSEQIFLKWNSSTRLEFLEHYLPLGWSMGVWDEKTNKLIGYFLAQVLLFYQGKMQCLHIEHMSFNDSSKIFDILFDTAYRHAKEKHLQSLIVPCNIIANQTIKPSYYTDKQITILLK